MKYNVVVCDNVESYFNDVSGLGIEFKSLAIDEFQFIMKIAFKNNFEIIVRMSEGD